MTPSPETQPPPPPPLPTARRLLTSLINSIAHIPLPEAEGEDGSRPQPRPDTATAQQDGQRGARRPPPPERNRNPLELLPPPSRALLAALHVLFPALLLPALDLLDRGAVARLVLVLADDLGGSKDENERCGAACVYQVRPTGQGQSRPRRGRGRGRSGPAPGAEGGDEAASASTSTGTVTGAGHIVHLDAWNCTCAPFAFSAFPPSHSSSIPPASALSPGGIHPEGREGVGTVEDYEGEPDEDRKKDGDGDGEDTWQFGGLSLDGLPGPDGNGNSGGGGGVPCCKHLLACLLAERWRPVLGRYVAERRVGREEMAGVLADV